MPTVLDLNIKRSVLAHFFANAVLVTALPQSLRFGKPGTSVERPIGATRLVVRYPRDFGKPAGSHGASVTAVQSGYDLA